MSRINNALIRYIETPAFRGMVASIPYVGSSIDAILSSSGEIIRQRRIDQTISGLKEEMVGIEEKKIDKKFLESEEFYDIALDVFRYSIRTRHTTKVILYCKILAGSVLLDNSHERHSAEDFLGFISELSPIDIRVAAEIYKQQSRAPEVFDSEEKTQLKFIVNAGWHNIRKICKLDETDFQIALSKLSRAGLIKEIVGMYIEYTGGLYLITPAFKRLMKFIGTNMNEPLFNYEIEKEHSDL
jgi:hypothetical protein